MKSALQYTDPTPNPEVDAARHDADIEAADEFIQEAQREAPGIVLKQLQALKTPADWFDQNKFHAGNSAESILRDAMDDSNDPVGDAYAEFITDATLATKLKMLSVMADWFCKTWAYEVYTDHLEGSRNV